MSERGGEKHGGGVIVARCIVGRQQYGGGGRIALPAGTTCQFHAALVVHGKVD